MKLGQDRLNREVRVARDPFELVGFRPFGEKPPVEEFPFVPDAAEDGFTDDFVAFGGIARAV